MFREGVTGAAAGMAAPGPDGITSWTRKQCLRGPLPKMELSEGHAVKKRQKSAYTLALPTADSAMS